MEMKRILMLLAIVMAVACEESKPPTDVPTEPGVEEPVEPKPEEPVEEPTEPEEPEEPTEPQEEPTVPEEPSAPTPEPEEPKPEVPVTPKAPKVNFVKPSTEIAGKSEFSLQMGQGARTYAIWAHTPAGSHSIRIVGGERDRTFPFANSAKGWKRVADYDLNWSGHTFTLSSGIEKIVVSEDLKWSPVTPTPPTPQPEPPKPEEPKTPVGETVDISKCKVTGSADLERILKRTGGWQGGGACTLAVSASTKIPAYSVKITQAGTGFTIEGNAPKSMGATWAASEFARAYVGVIWPFPHKDIKIAEYVPKSSTLKVPKKDHTYTKILQRSDFRQSGRDQFIKDWLHNRFFLETSRTEGAFNHYDAESLAIKMGVCTKLPNGKYKLDWTKDPDNFFAVDKNGKKQAWSGDCTRLKLNLSNPKVVAHLKKEIEGKKFFSWSQSDSSGNDTTAASMSRIWKYPNTEANRELVWRGSEDLSDGILRHALEVVKGTDVIPSGYVYAYYRECPKDFTKANWPYSDKSVVMMVPSNWTKKDQADWKCWDELTKTQYLRVNWAWNVNRSIRYPLTSMGEFLNFAAANGNKGADHDTYQIGPNWAFNFLISENARDPHKPYKQINDDLITALGGSAEVKKGLELLVKASEEYGLPSGKIENATGAYKACHEQRKVPYNYLAGSFFSLPCGWPDSKVTPIIAEFKKAFDKTSGEEKARLKFVLDSFDVFVLYRDMFDLKGQVCFGKKDRTLVPKYEAKATEYVNKFKEVIGIPTNAEMKFNECNASDQSNM